MGGELNYVVCMLLYWIQREFEIKFDSNDAKTLAIHHQQLIERDIRNGHFLKMEITLFIPTQCFQGSSSRHGIIQWKVWSVFNNNVSIHGTTEPSKQKRTIRSGDTQLSIENVLWNCYQFFGISSDLGREIELYVTPNSPIKTKQIITTTINSSQQCVPIGRWKSRQWSNIASTYFVCIM